MRMFSEHNPFAVTACIFGAAGVAMFSMDPVILCLSLAGALTLTLMRPDGRRLRPHLWMLLLFAAMALVNPLVNHRGETVLLVMNHRPVTLEALLYGLAAGGMVLSVMYWFRSYTAIMTSDRLLYLFGALSPRLALVLSMALRYVPLFGQQARRIQRTQQALGLYRDDNVIASFRGGLSVFSSLTTWALENGVVTADSMTARGYGTGKRTRFSPLRFTRHDAALLTASLLLTALTLWGIAERSVAYYPTFTAAPMDLRAWTGCGAYALLVFLPAIIDGKEALRWRCLQSKI